MHLGQECEQNGEDDRHRRTWTSGPSTLNEDQIVERGARMARRDDRAYREYVREEQRRQPGCPAREVVLDQRGRATCHCSTPERRGTVTGCGALQSCSALGFWRATV